MSENGIHEKLRSFRDEILDDLPSGSEDLKDGFFCFRNVFSPLVELACILLKAHQGDDGKSLSPREFRTSFLQVLSVENPGALLSERRELSRLDQARINSLVADLRPELPDSFTDIILTINEISGMEASDFLRLLYRQLLGREPDQAGLVSWIVEIERGGSFEEVLKAIDQSEERRALNRPYSVRIMEEQQEESSNLVARMRCLQEIELLRVCDLAKLILMIEQA